MPTEYVQSATAFNIFRVKRCWSNKNVLLTLATKKKKKKLLGDFLLMPSRCFCWLTWHDKKKCKADKKIELFPWSYQVWTKTSNGWCFNIEGLKKKKTFKDIFGYDWDFSVLTLWIYHKKRKILFYHAWWYSCNKSLDRNNFICVPKAHRNKNWSGWEKVRSKFKCVTLF